MKKLILCLLLASCSSQKIMEKINPKYGSSCFIIYDLKEKSYVVMDNQADCHSDHPAASTFKVPLAVIAFETGVLKDKTTTLKWDGKKRMIDAWNKDATAESWMHDSVVWYSQRITPKIGQKKMESFLKSFNYGNHDMSGGILWAWLTPAPFSNDPIVNTLQVSGTSQTHFLENLWNETLPVSKESQQKAKGLLAQEKSPNGAILRGKTGSGFVGLGYDLRVGWYVGYFNAQGKDYIVVSNFVDRVKLPGEKSFGGREAKENAIQRLTEMKLW